MNEVEKTLNEARKLKVSVSNAAKAIGVNRCAIYRALKEGRTEPIKMGNKELLLLREVQKRCKEKRALIYVNESEWLPADL